MKIIWLGHSCFCIEKEGYRIVLDPYTAGSVPGLDSVDLQAQLVLCSHEHGDHNGRGEVTLTEQDEAVSPFSVEILETWHDEVQGAKRGANRIFIISDGTQCIAHFGDLGCDLTTDQKEQLKGLDVALIPVGGFYTIDGGQAADLMHELKPVHIIPMHFRDDIAGFGFNEISTVDTFTDRMDSVVTLPCSEIDTAEEYGAQVLVLHPLRN